MPEDSTTDPHIVFFDRQWRAFRARLLKEKQLSGWRTIVEEARVMEADEDPLVAAYARQRRATHERWIEEEER